jgi:hypothetical protein
LLTPEEAERYRTEEGEEELADLIGTLIDQDYRRSGESNGIMLITRPQDPGTVTLPRAVVNDFRDSYGRVRGWARSHRYTSLARLKTAKHTSDLNEQ